MNNNIFSIMIVICVVFLVIFAGIYSVYIYKPEFLGITPPSDSIKVVNHSSSTKENLTPLQYEIIALSRQRDSLQKIVSNVSDSLSKLKSINSSALRDVETLKLRYNEQDKQVSQHLDSLVKANYTLFAQIYDKAGAKEVAKILSELDERDAAFILKTMKPKNAAKVLDEMNPIQAAAIMVLGANQPLK